MRTRSDERAPRTGALAGGWERTRRFTAEVTASVRHRPGIDRVDDQRRAKTDDSAHGVHARIAARRAEVAAGDASARRSRLVSSALGVALAAGVACVVMLTPILSVRDVEVVGADAGSGVDADAVLRVAGVHDGDNLLLVNASTVTGGVTTLPGIESATVTKTLPGSVRIEVVPRPVAAVTAVGQGFALLDPSSTVIEVRRDLSGVTAPVVRGSDPPAGSPPGDPTVAQPLQPGERWEDGLGRQAVRAVVALPKGSLPRVLEAGYDRGALTMKFAGTPDVVFGTGDDIEAKARVLVSVLADLAARGANVEYVDVSSPVVPTVRPRS